MKKARHLRWVLMLVLLATMATFSFSTTPTTQAQGPTEGATAPINLIPVDASQTTGDGKTGSVPVDLEALGNFNTLAATAGGETEPNNTSATANPITLPTVVKGNLYPATDVDYYSVALTAGDVFFAATQTSFSAGNSTDSVLALIAPDGTTVVEEDDNNGSFAATSSSLAGVPVLSTGTYYVRVRIVSTANTIRPYYLYAAVESGAATPEVEPNDTNVTAMPLPASGYILGSLSAQTDADWYSFTANAGDTIYYTADADPERDTIDTPIRVGMGIFANNILVVNDLTAGADPDSEAFFLTVKNSGTYYAYVDSGGVAVTAPATYRFSLTVLPAESRAACTTYTYTGGTVPIVDAGRMTTTLSVPSPMIVGDINVTVNLTHTFMQDLDVSLVSPQGNYNGVFSDIGAGTVGGPLTTMNLTFDDEAAIPPSFTVADGLVLQPELAYRLNWYDGEQAQGTWQLVIDDDAATDSGNLLGWNIDICPQAVVNPAPTCPAGTQQVTVFSSDFEAGAAGFTHAGTLDEWELGLPAPLTPATNPIASCNSGSSCWKTDLDGTYEFNSDQELLSPALNLANPLYTSAWVQWSHRYQIENASFDHYRVQAQQVGGTNRTTYFEWLDATMTNAIGTPLITRHESAGWGVNYASLNSYLGLADAQMRWNVTGDGSVNMSGAAVDDVSVYACQLVPTATPTNTATNTPVPPTSTATNTATNTPVPPTNTATNTATNTPVPPTNTATNTATNTPAATATATATPNGNPLCVSPNVAIPDGIPAGITSVLNVGTSGTLTDLNVSLDVTHSWVGDLIFTLNHGATTAELYDRPGVPASTFGCSGDNFVATADDEGATSFEAACTTNVPAFPVGNYIPGDPAGPNLAAFDGANINGTWTLTASDNAAGDTGTLNTWCLVPTLGTGPTSTATATTQATATATATATTQATATATATATTQATSTATPTTGATATASATPGTGGTYCSTAPLTIPDANPTGATSVINVSDSATISDLNVSLDVTHTWVGDLTFNLNHGATNAELYDQPGVPASTFGCSGDNFVATADDEGATSFEAACTTNVPAFPVGNYIPGDPAGPNLAAFDGANINGTWTLTASDLAAGDTGVLNQWCLIVGGGGPTSTPTPTGQATATPTVTPQPGGPEIDANPTAFSETHNNAPQTTTDTLTISNLGDATLTWTITEDNSAAPNPIVPRDPNAVPQRLGPTAPTKGNGSNTLGSIVGDGSFETGSPNASWEEFSQNFGTPLCTVAGCGTGTGTGPRTGEWWSWFGGIASAETGAITQTVTIPSGSAELAFWLEIPAGAVGQPGFMAVRMDGDELFRVTETSTGYGTYTEVTVDVSTYADGGAHELSFYSETQAGASATNFFVDDVSITASSGPACDAPSDIPWLSVSPTNGSTSAGGSSNVTLTYNSTGLVNGTYTGSLCLASNDADESVINIPVSLTVTIPTAVDLGSITQSAGGFRVADFAAAGVLLLAGVVLLFRRRK